MANLRPPPSAATSGGTRYKEKHMRDIKGLRALVTGASSGIGEAFARLLAENGADLVLTARRADRLTALANELAAAHGVQVDTVPLDMEAADAPVKLLTAARGAAPPDPGPLRLDILINNAGFGYYGNFTDLAWPPQAATLHVNMTALTELSYLFVQTAKAVGGPAWLCNVSSIGAFQPVPKFATYAASKAYVLSFTEALALELSESAIRVSCLCPGGTKTEFFERSGQRLGQSVQQRMLMSPTECAKAGLRGLLKGKRKVVPGALNRFTTWAARHAPSGLAARVAERILRPDDEGK
jgi:uncharacterized protein